ncbi:MAG: oligopeptidase B, partial [candidate division Zixibacteria bacterium]|nr:oligopeptidase B [candidate division Zixibacteria bacterium]
MISLKMRRISLALVLSGIIFLSCGGQSDVQPPVAKTEAKVDTLFGLEMVDNYYWMRDKENPEVIQYLKAENAYTEAKMAHTKELQDSLFIEMKSRIKETDLSVPVKRGNYYYYSRTEEGKQYKIYCRKEGSLDAGEEVLLDVNALAEGLDYYYLGVYEISPDHKLLAYAADTSGNERYSIYIKDLETGELRSDVVHNAGRSFEWANDNRTFFYNISDDAWRSYQIYKHRLGENAENDDMIFQEDDDSYDVWLYKSKDDRYIFMHTGNQTTSEVYFLNANYPTRDFKVIQPRTEDVEYWAYHHGGYFYIVTNENALNYKLMRTSIFRPQISNWQEVIAHRDSV